MVPVAAQYEFMEVGQWYRVELQMVQGVFTFRVNGNLVLPTKPGAFEGLEQRQYNPIEFSLSTNRNTASTIGDLATLRGLKIQDPSASMVLRKFWAII